MLLQIYGEANLSDRERQPPAEPQGYSLKQVLLPPIQCSDLLSLKDRRENGAALRF